MINAKDATSQVHVHLSEFEFLSWLPLTDLPE
jgi:hypothetical protein